MAEIKLAPLKGTWELCYVIFDPRPPVPEVYRLVEGKRYHLCLPDENQRYAIPELELWLGIWQGTWDAQEGYWLRWWDQEGELLPLGTELAERERQRAEAAAQRAEAAEQRAARLAAQLRAAGLDPEN